MPRVVFFLAALFLAFLFAAPTEAQMTRAVSVRYVGLSVHLFGSKLPERFPYRLDEGGILVAHFGGMISVQSDPVTDWMNVRALVGLFTDSGGFPAGTAHLGVKVGVLRGPRHYVDIGFGPTLYFREDWAQKYPRHRNETFNIWGKWEYVLIPYGANIEYHFRLSDWLLFTTSLVPAVPDALNFSAGLTAPF